MIIWNSQAYQELLGSSGSELYYLSCIKYLPCFRMVKEVLFECICSHYSLKTRLQLIIHTEC